MAEFQFLQDPISKQWISLSPRRAKRPNSAEAPLGKPDEAKDAFEICPFCPGEESKDELAVYSVDDANSHWLVRVFPNKFPFAQVHEVVIHSPDHHKSFGELPLSQVSLILQTYRQRYNTHKEKGQVYIMNNTGEQAGESIPHPHSQIVVVPNKVTLDISAYDISDDMFVDAGLFRLGCPSVSKWPDEVWFVPKETGKTFGEISDDEITSLANTMDRVVRLYDHRYGHEFPFNFFIKPGLDWYLRFIPRVKSLGAFEVGTNVYVNTQDPKETVSFIKEHFQNPDFEKITREQQASYKKHV